MTRADWLILAAYLRSTQEVDMAEAKRRCAAAGLDEDTARERAERELRERHKAWLERQTQE